MAQITSSILAPSPFFVLKSSGSVEFSKKLFIFRSTPTISTEIPVMTFLLGYPLQ